MLFVFHSKKFSKSLNRLVKSNRITRKEVLFVIEKIAEEKKLDEKFKDHQLKGNMREYRECHIKNDVLLQYQVRKDIMILVAVDIGTHSDLFG